MKKLYRADNYYKTVEYVEVDDDAPIGFELPPLFGDGMYIYFETQQEANNWLAKEIQTEIDALVEKLKELQE
jgi:hypothetical protein